MSMRRGSFAFRTPMLWAIGGIVVIGIAGLNVIVVANAGTNRVLHDTYFVVAHMDYLVSQAAVFGVFAGWYYLFPKVTGYSYSDVLGKIHFWLSFIGVNTMYVPLVLILWDMAGRIGDAPMRRNKGAQLYCACIFPRLVRFRPRRRRQAESAADSVILGPPFEE